MTETNQDLNRSSGNLVQPLLSSDARQYADPERGIRLWQWGAVRDSGGTPLTPEALALRFAAEREALFEQLKGQYALLLTQGERAWLVADRFATERLFVACSDGVLWVSDRLDRLVAGLPQAPSIRPQALADYLFFHMIPGPETLYEGVTTLTPGELICFERGELRRRRYWQPQFQQRSAASAPQLAKQLFTTLEQAVVRRLGDRPVGCFLSGGLDSSSIAGLVARHRAQPAVFSIGFPLEQYNELAYARCAVSHFGLAGHEHCMQPEDVVEALPGVVASMEQPFGNSSVLPTYFCARLAKQHGIARLIAGDGGDELFAGNERYAHQLKLQRWRERLGPLLGLLDLSLLRPSWPEQFALLNKAKSFTRQLKMSIPERLEYYNFFNLLDRQALFVPELARQLDLGAPDRRCQALYAELADASPLDRMLYMDWKHTLADNDLIKVSSMCRYAGVEVVYPMLDDDLVDLSLTIPDALKLTPGSLRHLFKQAMAGFLPEQIIHKSKHGFGLPFGLWTQSHAGLRALAYDALDTLPGYNFFNRAFIDEVKRLHQREHAKHYGELVWVLMILALWLNQHSKG